MFSIFEKHLLDQKLALLTMAGEVERQLNNVLEAFFSQDIERAEQVIEGDKQIDFQEVENDRKCLFLLSRYQPVARDLRLITAIMRINSTLERIGDEAVHIAKQVIILSKRPLLMCCREELPAMGYAVNKMVKEALDSFVNEDVELALKVWEHDQEIDQMSQENMKKLLDFIVHETPAIRRGVTLIMITHSLERIGDLAAHIAEQTVFFVEGRILQHGYEWEEIRKELNSGLRRGA